VWIELGGQLEANEGLASSFTAPFLTAISPTPEPYRGDIFAQKPTRYSIGLEGSISVQPKDSEWKLSVGVRYGRSHTTKHTHHQTTVPTTTKSVCFYSTYCLSYTNKLQGDKVADNRFKYRESHLILDFQAGKDIGIGLFGKANTSLSAGIRFAQFSSKSSVDLYGRPDIGRVFPTYFHLIARPTFTEYFLDARAERSFTGAGPSISWNGTATIVGNSTEGELALDWGANAALLFGRQKAKTYHQTHAYRLITPPGGSYPLYGAFYTRVPKSSTRSRSVVIPNLGGFAGLSVKYPNAKFALGYRVDTFFGATDTGIDARKSSNVTFRGPFASISIGLGG
jgi:hypothetical protein